MTYWLFHDSVIGPVIHKLKHFYVKALGLEDFNEDTQHVCHYVPLLLLKGSTDTNKKAYWGTLI